MCQEAVSPIGRSSLTFSWSFSSTLRSAPIPPSSVATSASIHRHPLLMDLYGETASMWYRMLDIVTPTEVNIERVLFATNFHKRHNSPSPAPGRPLHDGRISQWESAPRGVRAEADNASLQSAIRLWNSARADSELKGCSLAAEVMRERNILVGWRIFHEAHLPCGEP